MRMSSQVIQQPVEDELGDFHLSRFDYIDFFRIITIKRFQIWPAFKTPGSVLDIANLFSPEIGIRRGPKGRYLFLLPCT
jgi:hypothetical protein